MKYKTKNQSLTKVNPHFLFTLLYGYGYCNASINLETLDSISQTGSHCAFQVNQSNGGLF